MATEEAQRAPPQDLNSTKVTANGKKIADAGTGDRKHTNATSCRKAANAVASDKTRSQITRSRKMATAERDLASQADAFLGKLLGEGSSDAETRENLVGWLSSELNSERQGWKKKLQMSMKEIERERRMAMEVHSAIHEMNALLENGSGPVQLFREPSMYRGSDKDLKTSHIQQLQKNIDAVRNMNLYFEKERTQCFAVLEEGDTEQNLVPVLRQKFETLRGTVEKMQRELNNAEAKIEKLSGTLESERTLYREASMSRAQEIKQLRAIVEDFRRPSGGELRRQERQGVDAAVQAWLRVPTRECCIQTDVDAWTRKKPDLTSVAADACQQRESRVSGKMPSPVTEVRISKPHPKARDVMQISNVGNTDFACLPSLGTGSPSSTRGVFAKDVEERVSRYCTDFETRKNADHKQIVDYLREQIVGLAHQVEQTREQVELYQKQVAFLKKATQKPDKEKSLQYVPPVNPWLQAGSIRSWSSEGYLSGTKISDREAGVNFMHLKQRKSQQSSNKMAANGATAPSDVATARCLRCQKRYRLRNNHQGACLYHLKEKRKVERYDASGKLLRMSMVWECCKASAESPGCAVGQHV